MNLTDYSAQETITRGVEMYGQDALAIWLTVMGPVLSSVVNEAGQTKTFVVRALYNPSRYTAPAYGALAHLGRHVPETSQGLRGSDPHNPGYWLFARVYQDTTIEVRIEAESEAEREWMIDLLLSGYELAYAADASGNLIPYPVGEILYSKGFVYHGTDKPLNLPPEVNASDATPQGRIFPATVTFHYDLTVSLSVPGIIVGSGGTLKNNAVGQGWPVMPVGSPPSPGWGPFPVGPASLGPGWQAAPYGTPASPGYVPLPVGEAGTVYTQPPIIGPVVTITSV